MNRAYDLAPPLIRFFLFYHLHEKTALQSAYEVLNSIAKVNAHLLSEDQQKALIVQAAESWLAKKRKIKQGTLVNVEDFRFESSQKIELGPWREFKRISESEEFSAVLWTLILGFPARQVAAGLHTTEGTVKLRVSRGLKKLGRLHGTGTAQA